MTITLLPPQHSLQSLATTVNRGVLNGQSVHPAPTEKSAQQLAGREETPQGRGVLSRIGAQLARPFIALREWVGQLLNPGKSDTPVQIPHQAEKSVHPSAELLKQQARLGLAESVNGLAKVSKLNSVTADNLVGQHHELATNNGSLRALTTALRAAEKSQVEPYASAAKAISTQIIGGQPVSQWGDTGGKVSTWLSEANTTELTKAAQQIRQLVPQIHKLEQAINRELNGEPSPAPQKPLAHVSDVDWSSFTPEMSANDKFNKLGEITKRLMTYHSAQGEEISSSVSPTNIVQGFGDIKVVTGTLIEVSNPVGKYPVYNAHYVQNGTAIASQAPMRGENSSLFANLLVQEKPSLIVNLTNENDPKLVDYFSSGLKEMKGGAKFEGHAGNGFFSQLDVMATSGDTYSLTVARAPLQDKKGADIENLHAAVVKVSDWMDENGGLLLVHCLAGVGRTGMFLEALQTYKLFKAGQLTPENYAAQVLSGAATLRTERSEFMIQKPEQLQTNLNYAKELVSGNLQVEKADEMYMNSAFSRQLEEGPEYMNTRDLQVARNILPAAQPPEALYVNSDVLRAAASAEQNDVGVSKKIRPPVAAKPTRH